jgi:hypothetical protein
MSDRLKDVKENIRQYNSGIDTCIEHIKFIREKIAIVNNINKYICDELEELKIEVTG